jgi:DnaD/phage-associated family protein
MSESEFKGFPPRPDVTPLPNIFFSEVLPRMESPAEIKVVMQVFFLLSRKKGYPRFISFEELRNDPVLVKGLGSYSGDMREIIGNALEEAARHGILLHIPVDLEGKPDEAYFINNEAEKDTIAKIREGNLKIPQITIRKAEEVAAGQPSDIYNLYEQNIGILTPILAEELQEAEHRYPPEWIQEAFRIALRSNVRNWKYINGILKRWEREGKQDGKHVGDTRQERDPDKYHRGKYGHMVQR